MPTLVTQLKDTGETTLRAIVRKNGSVTRQVYPSNAVLFSNSKTTQNDSNWKVKVVKRLNATNPYSLSMRRDIYGPRTSIRSVCKNANGDLLDVAIFSNTQVNPSIALPPLVNSTADDIALKKFKSKLYDEIGYFQSMTPVAELTELRKGAISMIDSAAKVSKSNIGAFNRKGFRWTKRSLIEFMADGWLQWSFGIKPTLGAIEDANAAIAAFLSRKDHVARVFGSGTVKEKTYTNVIAEPVDLYNYGWTLLHSHGISTISKTSMSGSFDLKLASANDYSPSNVFGLNPSSILPTLYELTAFSWVLDYFTTVGEYLNDTFVLTPGSMIYLSRSRTSRSFGSELIAPLQHPSTKTVERLTMLPGKYQIVRFNRESLPVLPTRIIRVKTQDEIGKRALNKLLNLVSVQIGLASKQGIRTRM